MYVILYMLKNLFQFSQYFFWCRETPPVMFREYFLIINRNVKYSARTGNKFNLNIKACFYIFLQTGSTGEIISCGAIFDSDLHKNFTSK